MHYVIAHYHELALKGRNRPMLVDRLVRNIREGLRGIGRCHVESLAGRIRITIDDPSQWSTIKPRLDATFGLANFAPAHHVSSNIETMSAAICETVQGLPFHTFRVTTKRADKSYPLTSIEVDRHVGAAVVERTGAHVSLGHPEMTIFIEILGASAYYYCERFPGAGGLPVGMSGKVACLLSGGIDSPVAAWRMMKRGCSVFFVHFHSYPYLSKMSQEKVGDIAEILNQYQRSSKLFLIPFGDIQKEIVLHAPARYRVVLYRRMMVRITEAIAKREKALALVTGESLC